MVTELESFESIHKYHIARLIAQGGMGSVYEARQLGAEGFEKTVAIKEMIARLADDQELTRLFVGEAKLVADLVHENIVQVYNLGRVDGRYFIVMEYVDGINLEQFLRYHLEGGIELPIKLGAFIISRVCRGLDYAHSKTDRQGTPLGIVHRDISPKNVLLNMEGVVKVTDFGIAKARQVMVQDEDVLMGRMEYMSPEQAQRRTTDCRSDIYSVGVLLYELLAGCLPSEGSGTLSRLHRLGLALPRPIQEIRPEVPRDLWVIINTALQPDPAERFQTAGEMGYALEHHLYSAGYGPTNLTLGAYLRQHFAAVTEAPASETMTGGTRQEEEEGDVVRQRAETLFGELLLKELARSLDRE